MNASQLPPVPDVSSHRPRQKDNPERANRAEVRLCAVRHGLYAGPDDQKAQWFSCARCGTRNTPPAGKYG